MPEVFYTTKDVIKQVGISRNTLFLWFKHKKILEIRKDRNGHRIFAKKDINTILAYKNRLIMPRK